MEALIAVLRPLVEPLLKLDFRPPHLPEGSTLVRQLRPSPAWLQYRYLATLFGLLTQVIGTGVAVVALLAQAQAASMVLVVFLVVLQAVTLAVALVTTRVDYDLRHYLVGDRSLRAVMGALKRNEVTLSYANVQNIEVTQGPLERLFGFKSLTVTTAGADATPRTADNLHVVTLVGLDDADGVKSLIMRMLRGQRETGLGDPGSAENFASPALLEVLTAAKRLEAASNQETLSSF